MVVPLRGHLGVEVACFYLWSQTPTVSRYDQGVLFQMRKMKMALSQYVKGTMGVLDTTGISH